MIATGASVEQDVLVQQLAGLDIRLALDLLVKRRKVDVGEAKQVVQSGRVT